MSSMISANVIVCYFHRDSSGLAAAFRDKKQTSFLLQFLKSLSPKDIECMPNYLEITCDRQITELEIVNINQKLQSTITNMPQHLPLRNCEMMLKITFELCRLLEGVQYVRKQYKDGSVSPSQIDNYLLEISQQIQQISPTNIKNDLFITQPTPKTILQKNKKRISAINTPSMSHVNSPKIQTIKQIKYHDLMEKKQCKQEYYTITESTLKYLPIPNNDKYPIQLYTNISHSTSNMVRYDYNTNNSSSEPIYPNDMIYDITLKDFIDRKFHISNNIIKKWVNDRAYLIEKLKDNDDESKEDDDFMNVTYRKFVIIDVRCDDFVGGNIPYCYNINYEIFDGLINDLLIKFESDSDIIFHCMYSQYRGPRAAYKYYIERRKWENKYNDKLVYKQRIWVLDGGFKQWISDYILDSDLVSNFNNKYWDDEYFPLTGREFFYRNDWKPSHQGV